MGSEQRRHPADPSGSAAQIAEGVVRIGPITPFTYTGAAVRVVFGPGSIAALGDELDRLGLRRVLLLTTPEQMALADRAAVLAGARVAGTFSGAAMHTPVSVTDSALLQLRAVGGDGLVALGGGSTIGLAKALAARTGLPQVAVPTTYAGSEMTPILGETADGRKATRRLPAVLPNTVLYDPELTASLPLRLSVVSGINAMAHAAEALYAQDANPVTSLMAEEGLASMARSLPRLGTADGAAARTDALYGAWLCGTCLGAVGMALHHKICHVLGGLFGLRHAEMHTVVLPHALAFNAPAAPQAMHRIARALGADHAPSGMFALARQLGAPSSLEALGMPEEGIGPAAEHVMQDAYWNPRPLEIGALHRLLRRAWQGEPPRTDE